MPRKSLGVYLQLLTYCMSMGLSFALFGLTVRNAKANEFRYAVSISTRATSDQPVYLSRHRCTGTLVNFNKVLTVAHCLLHQNKSDLEVIAGTRNLKLGQVHRIRSWITYHEWLYGRQEDQPYRHDIAIITLRGEGVQNVTPISLLEYNVTMAEREIRMAGWGKTETHQYPHSLRTGSLTVISNEECGRIGRELKAKEAKRLNARPFGVPPNYFCSKANPPVVAAHGDAGAPITFKRHNQLIGIHVGRAPVLEQVYSAHYLHHRQINTHLVLLPYLEFIDRYNI